MIPTGTITVIVKKEFPVDGRLVAPGEFVHITPIEALKLHRSGHITLSRSSRLKPPALAVAAPEPPSLPPTRPLIADDEAPVADEDHDEKPLADVNPLTSTSDVQPATPRTRRPRRQYRRAEVDVDETATLEG